MCSQPAIFPQIGFVLPLRLNSHSGQGAFLAYDRRRAAAAGDPGASEKDAERFKLEARALVQPHRQRCRYVVDM